MALLLMLAACTQAAPLDTATPSSTPPPATATAAPFATAPPTEGPPPTVPPTPAPTVTPTSVPGPLGSDSTLPESVYSRVLEIVADVRGLEIKGTVVPSFMTRDELVIKLTEELDTLLEEVIRHEEVYRLMGLIPQDADLGELLLELYGGQVAGFYDSETDELYIVGEIEEELSVLDEIILAHEYVHALQQQHFDIQSLSEDHEDNSDSLAAVTALVEGDAVHAEERYMATRFTQRQIGEAFSSVAGDSSFETPDQPSDLPPYFLEQNFIFPYVQGSNLVQALLGSSSEWDAVNRAYADPPVSTEQVLHPEKYLNREAPIPVSLPDLAPAVGRGWENVRTDTMGEFFLKTYLEARAKPTMAALAADAAGGWGGDAFTLLKGPGDEYAMAALIVWDTEQDAGEFFGAMHASNNVPPEDFLGLDADRVLWVLSDSAGLTERIRSQFPGF